MSYVNTISKNHYSGTIDFLPLKKNLHCREITIEYYGFLTSVHYTYSADHENGSSIDDTEKIHKLRESAD